MSEQDMHGLLLVDKPLEWTSFDVVAKIRGVISRELGKKMKVGHSGTLDPMATGLLVLAIGKDTKKIQELTKLDKVYDVEMTLGATSTTDDQEGEITPTGNNAEIEDMTFFDDTMISFIGEIDQVPPAFSAIKVDGKRAYKLAREGKEVKLEPRKVSVKSLTKVDYEHPKVFFEAEVSSGTYIRSLVRDIGEKLGTGAYMSQLRRLQVGEFTVDRAISLDEIDYNLIRTNIRS